MSRFNAEVDAAVARNQAKKRAGCLPKCRWWEKGNRWWHDAACPNNVGFGPKRRPYTEAEQDRDAAALTELDAPWFPSREVGEEWATEEDL